MVPRWNGDSSFMAVFGETRVVPELLVSTYDRIKPLFAGYPVRGRGEGGE